MDDVMSNMNFFNLLDFKEVGSSVFPYIRASHRFPNGYGVSVVCWDHTKPNRRYEVAVLHEGKLCYDTWITDDVLAHRTVGEVDQIMFDVSQLAIR
jgi:hypothetical protein